MTRNALLCFALALLAAGCQDGGTNPPVAASVAVSPASVSLDAVGATRKVHAVVTDQDGQPMPGASLSWSSSAPGVTVAGLGGDSAAVTAVANGSATVTASTGGVSGSVAVQVAQVATGVQKVAGDGQTAAAGTAAATPLEVGVRDRLGAPVVGATITFAVTGGGGTLSAASATTGPNGNAGVTWTLGTQAGSPQFVTASVAGLSSVVFGATVVAGPAATAILVAGNGQTAALGTAVAVAPRVQVVDAFNNPVAGVAVQFGVTSGGGSVAGASTTTDASGFAQVGSWTLGSAAGSNTLTASFPGTSIPPVVFTAISASAGSLVRLAGHNQAAMAGAPVPTVPRVVVRNASNAPLPGITVTFQVTAGGGTVGNATATTNADGIASAGSWVLGPQAGPNTLTASVAGLAAAPVVFGGTGCEGGGGTGYALTLCFTTTMTASQRTAFQNAAARWSAIITADEPNTPINITTSQCGSGSPSLNLTIDDLVIFAAVQPIDGPNGVLGSAGPCFIRDVAQGSLPVLGLMRFDAADVAELEANGQFGAVILHEMGHVLGIGTMWSEFGLLNSPSGSTPLDTWFSGTNAIAAFNAIGGSTYTGGQKVPVENTGGQGTANAHWRESVLNNELMTGYLDNGSNPLSLLTVRSLTDIGYEVDTSAADPFSVTLSLRAGGAGAAMGRKLQNDIYTGPVYVVDRQGRVVRTRN